MAIQDLIKRLIYQFSSTGADKVAADLGKVNAEQTKLAASSQETVKASLDLEKSFNNLERRFDSTIRAQQDYQKVQDKVNAAVAQHPELQERANNVLEKAGQYFEKAGTSATGFNAILDKGRTSLLGFAAEGGALGGVLGSFGPWGVAAAAGIGLISSALEYMRINAEKLGDVSSSLRGFADNTGLTITQIRGLSDAGGALGLSSDLVGSSLQKFTANLSDARKGTGDLYDQLRSIDRGLAEQIASTHDGAEALDVLAKAYNSTTDAVQKSAIARAAFGKAGASVGGILGELGDAGGVNAYSAAVAKALGVTDEWTKHVAALRNENKSLEEDLKLIEGSVYTEATLERQNRFLKQQVEIAKAIRDSIQSGANNNAAQFGGEFAGLLGGPGAAPKPFAQGGDPVVDQSAIAASTKATEDATKAWNDYVIAAARASKYTTDQVTALGSAATATEKEEARVAALTVAYNANVISIETYNRAVAANPAIKAADDATKAMQDQNELAKAATLEAQKRTAEEQKYLQVLKDTGDEQTAQNAAAAVGESYAIKIADANQKAHEKALALQADLMGVSQQAQQAARASVDIATALENAARAAQGIDLGRGGDFGSSTVAKGTQYTSVSGPATSGGLQHVTAASVQADIDKTIADQRAQLDATVKTTQERNLALQKAILEVVSPSSGANPTAQQVALGTQIAQLNAQPETIARDRAINDLTRQLAALTESTDSLNSTNQELLSPYYTQDPRTSHIGFRSQGMAAGGYVDVPGGISSQDNMVATIPVASGERIYIDPMAAKRGGGGTVINISAPMTFAGNVNRDEVGRTVYQTMQSAARQMSAVSR